MYLLMSKNIPVCEFNSQTGDYKMNIMTYLIGNEDNHDGNW